MVLVTYQVHPQSLIICITNSKFSCVTEEVGNAAAFLSSPLASAITGTVLYVDNGLNAMGVGVDSPIFKDLNIPKDQH
jgi:NAD(P)-dependent dehydrogenase (short-subunit alcohol dehydrogenase family)